MAPPSPLALPSPARTELAAHTRSGRAPDRLRRRRRRRGRPADPEPRGWGATGAALLAARGDSPRYPEGQWRTAITIKRLALRSAKAVKPQRQPLLPPLATSAALSRSPSPLRPSRAWRVARRRPPLLGVLLPPGGALSHLAVKSYLRTRLRAPVAVPPRTPRPSSPDVSIVWELFGEAGDGGGSP